VIQKHNNRSGSFAEVVQFVNLNGGIEYAKQKMNEFKDNSLKILMNFEDNDARKALIELVNYTIDRINRF